MIIVTSGRPFIDIDTYACMVAYAELLNVQGHQARATTTSVMNDSISASVKKWPADLQTDYAVNLTDTFRIVDMSDPDWFDNLVDIMRVTHVIDHNSGFEQYWKDRLGDKASIEKIGACATKVYEQWLSAGLLQKMSQTSARLLMSAILDNTLNFQAHITAQRDHAAYHALTPIAALGDGWSQQYFLECQSTIEVDLTSAIANDLKINVPGLPHLMAQIVIWDATSVLKQSEQVRTQLNALSKEWSINIVSVREGVSYFMSDSLETMARICLIADLETKGTRGKADRLWLRKELSRQALSLSPA